MNNTSLCTGILLCCLTACGGSDGETANTIVSPDIPPTNPPETQPPTSASVCDNNNQTVNWPALMQQDCPKLSDYGLFTDPTNPTQSPNIPGMSYQLSTELFSNYASKYRFVFLPQQAQTPQAMTYQTDSVFSLPVGSVLVKTFALPFDTELSSADNETKIETRLLIHRETGWEAIAYQWDNQMQQANLNIAGANIEHTLNNQQQSLTFNYHIPSKAECKVCHQSVENSLSRIMPIGLKAHLLNRPIDTAEGTVNQLQYWQQQGLLTALPSMETVQQSFALNDDTQSLTARAKGYLDVNCAHCHSAQGFASISGLRLGFEVDHHSVEYGVCKQPPGWDGGPNNLAYDIVPGNGERSIVHNRQILSAPKDRMPPIGREIIHHEGVNLVKQWIDSLPPSIGNCQ